MKLYDFTQAPNPRRVRMFLAEKGLTVESVQVDLMSKEQLSADFLKVNPFGTVPVLELDDGTRFVKCEGIARYLEAQYPDPPLMGRNAVEIGLVADTVGSVIEYGYTACADILRNKVPAFAGRSVAGPWATEQVPGLPERGMKVGAEFMKTLDGMLDGKEWLVADTFTWADICAVTWVDFAKFVRMELPDDCANVARWHAAAQARPSYSA